MSFQEPSRHLVPSLTAQYTLGTPPCALPFSAHIPASRHPDQPIAESATALSRRPRLTANQISAFLEDSRGGLIRPIRASCAPGRDPECSGKDDVARADAGHPPVTFHFEGCRRHCASLAKNGDMFSLLTNHDASRRQGRAGPGGRG